MSDGDGKSGEPCPTFWVVSVSVVCHLEPVRGGSSPRTQGLIRMAPIYAPPPFPPSFVQYLGKDGGCACRWVTAEGSVSQGLGTYPSIKLQLCRANSCGPPGQEARRTQGSHMAKALGRDPRVG